MFKPKDFINEYEILSTLGSGTVGTVYRVKNKAGDEYAMKMLNPAVTESPEIKSRFLREITVLEKLSHPNIVQYYGSGVFQGHHFYLMEIVDGGSLKEVLNQYIRLPWQDVIEIGWQVCSALQHAHNQGIVHRDLKPANLFLTSNGKLKLGDFGLALDLGAAELTDMGLTVGTYLYMAPEQIRGAKTISNQTDLYALGCLLYRMLAGRPPFEGSNFAAIFELHLHAKPPSLQIFSPESPHDLEEIILKLLKKKQEERPVNARAVQGMLAEVMMNWDEERAKETMQKKSQTWAIDPDRPILSGLIHKKPVEEHKISWTRMFVVFMAVVIFVIVLQLLGKK
jgi:serine/threonine protein kinase